MIDTHDILLIRTCWPAGSQCHYTCSFYGAIFNIIVMLFSNHGKIERICGWQISLHWMLTTLLRKCIVDFGRERLCFNAVKCWLAKNLLPQHFMELTDNFLNLFISCCCIKKNNISKNIMNYEVEVQYAFQKVFDGLTGGSACHILLRIGLSGSSINDSKCRILWVLSHMLCLCSSLLSN